jgi:hypothetical protein
MAIDPPWLMPFADNHDWMVIKSMEYFIGDTGVSITIPEGFVTDFASIPVALWSFGLSPHGNYSKAAIVHDFLYWAQNCTKKQADNILLIAMKESNVSSIKEDLIYQGVNLKGATSWKSNSKERRLQLPRVIPENYQNFPAKVTWSEYRASLVSAGVKDPVFPANPEYCKYGNSSKVP